MNRKNEAIPTVLPTTLSIFSLFARLFTATVIVNLGFFRNETPRSCERTPSQSPELTSFGQNTTSSPSKSFPRKPTKTFEIHPFYTTSIPESQRTKENPNYESARSPDGNSVPQVNIRQRRTQPDWRQHPDISLWMLVKGGTHMKKATASAAQTRSHSDDRCLALDAHHLLITCSSPAHSHTQ